MARSPWNCIIFIGDEEIRLLEVSGRQALLEIIGEQASNWSSVTATIISAVSLWVAIWVNHNTKRPQIIATFEFDSDKNIVYLVVQNLGGAAAYDVRFSGYDEDIFMDQFRPHVLKSFVTKGIPILVPGSKRSTIVAGGRIMDAMQDMSSEVTVTYREHGLIRRRIEVSEEFILEYSSFSGALYTDSETKRVRKALEKMEKDIGGLRDNLARMNRKVG